MIDSRRQTVDRAKIESALIEIRSAIDESGAEDVTVLEAHVEGSRTDRARRPRSAQHAAQAQREVLLWS